MKKILIIYIALIAIPALAQVGNYNQFPMLPPQHILDENKDEISFAYSLRILESDYVGPLIRLRRASDNAQQDFFCGQDDRVDLDAINTWRGGSNVFVTIWYDQSGLGINAIQTVNNRQPRFFPNTTQPYFVGDGANDILIVQNTIGNVTNNGAEATILGVFWASADADSAFGGNGGCSDRWYAHLNWNDGNVYWDCGDCSPTSSRSFANPNPSVALPNNRLEAWGQYSFIRKDIPTNATTDTRIVRLQGVERLNGDIPQNQRYSRTNLNFGICAPVNDTAGTGALYSTVRFAEFIMYNRGKSDAFVAPIEENQINFWGL